jgi:hypothetical protein
VLSKDSDPTGSTSDDDDTDMADQDFTVGGDDSQGASESSLTESNYWQTIRTIDEIERWINNGELMPVN